MSLSSATLFALTLIAAWLALNFVGVPGLVDPEPIVSLAGLMLGILVVFGLAGLAGVRFVAPIYGVVLVIWAALQIETHWSTYLLFDASERKLAWYDKVFGDLWHFLPPLAGRTVPDGYHTILAALILLNLALATRDVFGRNRYIGID